MPNSDWIKILSEKSVMKLDHRKFLNEPYTSQTNDVGLMKEKPIVKCIDDYPTVHREPYIEAL